MKKRALLVKAFTQNKDQGNPAGVVFDAQGMSEAQMILVAATLGFSESAFVSPSAVADYHIQFFTPTKEVPLCGHATIATFYSLVKEGRIVFDEVDKKTVTQETGAGILKVTCHADGLIVMEQTKPVFYKTVFDRDEVANLLGLKNSDLASLPIELVSTGTPKLMIPVTSLVTLQHIQPNLPAMSEFCAQSNVRGFYPFTTETQENSDFQARQFNPFAGIDEDPITGVAAGALGAYALRHQLVSKKNLVVEQGYFLNKGGKMLVTVDGDRVTVGGYAVIIGSQEIDIN